PAIVERNPLSDSTAAQLTTVDGKPLEELPATDRARRFLDSPTTLTVSRDLPKATKIVKGAWWTGNPSGAEVSVLDSTAEGLGIHVGSILEWSTIGGAVKQIRARVANVRRTDGVRFGNNGSFILSPGSLDGIPSIYFGSIRVIPSEIGNLQTRMLQS